MEAYPVASRAPRLRNAAIFSARGRLEETHSLLDLLEITSEVVPQTGLRSAEPGTGRSPIEACPLRSCFPCPKRTDHL